MNDDGSEVIPKFIIERAMKGWPSFAKPYITDSSTCVTSFGNPNTAKFASIGINPNIREFLGRDKRPRKKSEKLFFDYENLGITPGEPLSESEALKVIESCHNYFDSGVSPTDFFRINQDYVLSNISENLKYGKNAVHLDIVQWSTNPEWGELPKEIKSELMLEDAKFLKQQLDACDFEIIFLNGRTVIEAFEENFFKLDLVERHPESRRADRPSTRRTLLSNSFYAGNMNKSLVIGCTQFIGKRRTFDANWIRQQLQKFSYLAKPSENF